MDENKFLNILITLIWSSQTFQVQDRTMWNLIIKMKCFCPEEIFKSVPETSQRTDWESWWAFEEKFIKTWKETKQLWFFCVCLVCWSCGSIWARLVLSSVLQLELRWPTSVTVQINRDDRRRRSQSSGQTADAECWLAAPLGRAPSLLSCMMTGQTDK